MNFTSHDLDIIRHAIAVYLKWIKENYHRAAVDADDEETLRLSLAYESDKEYVCALLRKVGDATMVSSTAKVPDDHEEGNDNGSK